MTERQRLALEEFEQQTSIDLLKMARPDRTIVRPHVRGGKPADIKKSPSFIKRRIQIETESRLEEELTILKETNHL